MRYEPPFRLTNTHEYVAEFMHELQTETDRAAVVVSAAYADSLIEGLLIWNLLPADGRSDDLFDTDKGLTFSVKITLSARMGIIDAPLARSLHLLRKIRNEYAHIPRCSALAESPIKERTRELIRPYLGLPIEATVRQHFKCASQEGVEFRVASTLLCWTMVDSHGRWTDNDNPSVCNLIPEFFRERNPAPRGQETG